VQQDFLAVFMKSQGGGGVKTRLHPVLSKKDTTRLYDAFLQDTLTKLSVFACDVKVIAHAGELPQKNLFHLGEEGIKYWAQTGKTLGERLAHYFEWSFSEGARRSVVMGSDSPTLPLSYLKEAFLLLERYEVVIGPSLDGGYYLIGMTHSHPELFHQIPWSTGAVFQRTLSQNKHLEGKIGFLKPWYDVDVPEDLSLLKEDLNRMRGQKGDAFPHHTDRIVSTLCFSTMKV